MSKIAFSMASSCERIDACVSDLAALVTAVTSSPTFRTFAVDPAMVTDTQDQYESKCSAWARHCLAEVAAMAIAAGVAYHIVHDHPLGAIIDTAIKKRRDLILMASRPQGLIGAPAWRETTNVLTHTTIPTLAFR
jgi:nucleotide-binding universal stress UspA family protein